LYATGKLERTIAFNCRAVRHAKTCSGSHPAVIRVYDEAGNVIQTHEHKGDFKEA
jgi:hypothetical protein